MEIRGNENDFLIMKFCEVANTNLEKILETDFNLLMRLVVAKRVEEINQINKIRWAENQKQ